MYAPGAATGESRCGARAPVLHAPCLAFASVDARRAYPRVAGTLDSGRGMSVASPVFYVQGGEQKEAFWVSGSSRVKTYGSVLHTIFHILVD